MVVPDARASWLQPGGGQVGPALSMRAFSNQTLKRLAWTVHTPICIYKTDRFRRIAQLSATFVLRVPIKRLPETDSVELLTRTIFVPPRWRYSLSKLSLTTKNRSRRFAMDRGCWWTDWRVGLNASYEQRKN